METITATIKTDKRAFDYIRALGLKVLKNNGEWRIRIPGKPEADYFTNDRTDAVLTAERMARFESTWHRGGKCPDV